MSESRWAHGLFANSADLREQANQPIQLTLVRRGVFEGTGELMESLAEVHQQHPELGDTRVFRQQVRSFVDEALRTGHFGYSPAPPVDLLKRGQMEAIRAYTLFRPRYFDSLNKLLYRSQNAVFDRGLNAWQEFLFNLDTGLMELQQRHVAEGTSERVLHRVAWIPEEMYEQHFRVNNPVVFKGCASTSTEILESFYIEGLANPAEIEGKVCLVLEFDEVASRQAVDIRFLSAVQPENERLFPPCFRAKVVSDLPFEHFPSGLRPSRRPVRHLKLSGVDRVEAIPAILKWNGGISIEKLLELATFMAAHQEEQLTRLRGPLLQVEQCIRAAQSPRRLEAALIATRHALTRLIESVDPEVFTGTSAVITGVVGAVTRCPKTLCTAGLAGAATLAQSMTRTEASQRPAGTPLTPGQRLLKEVGREWALQLKALSGEINASPEDILHQLEINLPRHALLLQQVMAGDREEKELIRSLGSMLLEVGVIQKIVIGHPKEVICVLSTCFPVLQSKEVNSVFWKHRLSAAQQRGLRPYTPKDAELFHPVLAEIEVGDKLLAPPAGENLEASEAAKRVLASLDHLRLALSRTRIVFTLGPPDSGKSTLLNRVFGLQLPAGLGRRGRTKALTLIPCPDMPDILLADVPGFGDAQQEARNDAVRLMLSLAKIQGLMQILVVLKSSRQENHPMDDLVRAASSMKVPVRVVITQADKLFLDYSKGERPADVEDTVWWRQNADEIKEEDATRVTSLFPDQQPVDKVYTCFAGEFSQYAAASAQPQPYSLWGSGLEFLHNQLSRCHRNRGPVQQATSFIPPAFQAAFRTHFGDVLVSAEDLRDRILSSFRPVPSSEFAASSPPAV